MIDNTFWGCLLYTKKHGRSLIPSVFFFFFWAPASCPFVNRKPSNCTAHGLMDCFPIGEVKLGLPRTLWSLLSFMVFKKMTVLGDRECDIRDSLGCHCSALQKKHPQKGLSNEPISFFLEMLFLLIKKVKADSTMKV